MAFERVFADSSFFFALAAKRDPVHGAALAAFSGLLRNRRTMIVTTDYIIDEVLTLTKARTNSTVSLALLDRIERSEAVVLHRITPERFESAKSFFRKHADHGYSFTDCTSFVVMRELGIRDVLTGDQHFVEAGFRTLLPSS